MAGGMGWGIRGQYGHETGAMIAGLLVGLVIVLCFCPRIHSLTAARAVALVTIGISFGGSMTYGQTVGLTHDPELVGNWSARWWGLTGLFLKGGIWIGFAGAFLGMGLSGKRYRPLEMAVLGLVLFFLLMLGLYLFNRPFDPENRILPAIYFSDSWRWEPGADLRPRPERWGGLLLALAGLTCYLGHWRKDRLARNLVGWGFLGGGLGFSLGQSLQSFHAWNRTTPLFQSGWVAEIDRYINWWNMMETTFGAVFGFALALGVWRNRSWIAPPAESQTQSESQPELPVAAEHVLLAVHVAALAAWNFVSYPVLDSFADHGLTMGLIPLIAILGGRLWPYWIVFPITALPIAGKTVRELVFQPDDPFLGGWIPYFIVPLGLTLVAAWHYAKTSATGGPARSGPSRFVPVALLISTWMYFGLNWAFFRFPWPWEPWTARTPNGLIFFVCALGLTVLALARFRHGQTGSERVAAETG